MADRFVRKTGSDSNGGTSKTDAWLTIGKALGASGASSGDVIYIGAGTYREAVTVNMTSPVAETKVIGDVDGVKTADAGAIFWTAYTTNDTTTPSSAATLNLNARDYLTFENLNLIGGVGTRVVDAAASTTSTNITFRNCCIRQQPESTYNTMQVEIGFGTAGAWLIERCVLYATRGCVLWFTLTQGTGADYDANITVRNCVIVSNYGGIFVGSTSTGSNYGGGVHIYNCTVVGNPGASYGGLQTGSAISTTYPVTIHNSIIFGGVNAGTSGNIVEDYNHISAGTVRTNVTAGTNSKTGAAYAINLSLAQEPIVTGSSTRPYLQPAAGSPLLGFGNDGTYTSSEDITGGPRPAGGASASKGIGAYERANTATKETGTVRTGSNAIKLTGPGYQEFSLPVAAASTTVTVYGRFDATYAGTKPSMSVLNGTECGVSNATATMTVASGNWEQLSLNFTPTAIGIVTIRLTSSDTNGGGGAFFDDFAVA